VRDSTYYRQKAREAVARAQACDDRSAKLGWLDLAERYRRLGEPRPGGSADSPETAVACFGPAMRHD
jgi:hypothetical protein